MSSFKPWDFLPFTVITLLFLISALISAAIRWFITVPQSLTVLPFLAIRWILSSQRIFASDKYDEGFSGNVSYRGISMTARKRTHCGFHYLRYHLFNRLLLN